MNNLSSYSVRKPITVLMAIIAAIILGFVSLTRLQTELMPSINFPYAIVSTTYFGASPEEVEGEVTQRIEQQMATVENIKSIQSVSREHSSMVILEFNESTNMDSALIEMREKLDLATSGMSDNVGDPMIIKLNPNMMPIMAFSLSVGDMDKEEASIWYENKVAPRLERIPGVASVSVSGLAENEIQVILDDAKIELMGLDKEMISNLISAQNFSMPGGYVNVDGSNFLVRVGDKLTSIDDIKNLPISFDPNTATLIRIKDVADVKMVDISENVYSKVNGADSISISIQKQSNYATTDVAEAIEKELTKIGEEFDNVNTVMLMNQADYINDSVNSVSMNLIYGAILAVLVLFLFLRSPGVTLTIALAIPISVMFAFVLIYFSGISLNIVSMGGLALGIGMLVDNSIVVIENIYRLRNEGVEAKEAAIKGAKQVSGAITASTLTTISVFLPIVFLQGLTAEIFKEMALTITYSLLASLIIALSLVPAISARVLGKDQEITNNNRKQPIMEKVKSGYAKILDSVLKSRLNKSLVLLGTLVLFVLSIIGSINIGAEFFPTSDEGQITMSIVFDKEATYDEAVAELDALTEELLAINDIETVGASYGGGDPFMMAFGSGNSASINILLEDDRNRSTKEVSQEVRELTADKDYEVSITDTSSMSAMGGSGIAIKVKGQDLTELENIANDIADIIASVEGTTEVDNGIVKTNPEIKITVNKENPYNVPVAAVFMAVSEAIKGDSTTTSINIDGDVFDVIVKDKDSDRTFTIEDIENIVVYEVKDEEGNVIMPIKVSDVATVSEEFGFGVINREDQSRALTVSAKLESGYNIGKVSAKVQEKIDDYNKTLPNGYLVEVQGEQEEMNEAFSSLLLALVLAIVLVYMVMASQFQSLLSPFIVMFTIPLAFTGGFLGLFFTNTPISVVAFIGFIILAGIVVNNGIVLIDYVNQLREKGMNVKDALIEAGATRLRPIIMTALTTILALSTMALGVGGSAEMTRPMAITAIGGLIYSTILTLVVIPILYSMLNREKKIK